MCYLVKMTPEYRLALQKNAGWFYLWGAALVIIGGLAIAYAFLATLISVIVLGSLLIAGGVVLTIDAFHFWRRRGSAFYLPFLTGLLYIIFGGMVIASPVAASLSLTLILSIFYIFIGVFRLIYCFSHELPGKSWRIFNAILTLLIGILILMAWPVSGLYIIGLFIGIELIFLGMAYLFAAANA